MEGADQEAVPHCWHYWPVFGSGDVVEAQGVPADDVGVRYGTVGLYPVCQTVFCWGAGYVDSAGVTLVCAVGGYVELVLGEGADLLGWVVWGH